MKPVTGVRWLAPLWIVALAAFSAALTATYTCIVPFAALSVGAAMMLSTRQALLCATTVWLANQGAGFLLMGYPWTASAIGWGITIGAAAILATVGVQWLTRRLDALRTAARTVTAFIAAFAVYQATLYLAAVSVLGGTGAFAPDIIAQVLVVNVVTLVGLWGFSQLLTVAMSSYRRRGSAPARLA
jgi:hypothetical protein